MEGKKLYLVVNVDWFFLSHRLQIALSAKAAGYNVTVVAYNTGKREQIEAYGLNFIHVPFQRSGTNIFYELKCINILQKLYSRGKPHIIHHVTLKVSLYGSIAARLSSISNVVNAISGLGYNFTGGSADWRKSILMNLLKLGFKRKTTHFIFQNTDDVEVFKRLRIIEDTQVTMIKGSGVDLSTFVESPFPSSDQIHVLLPARILYDKGIVEYIEAANLLKLKFEDGVKFWLAGDIDEHNLSAIKMDDLLSLVKGGSVEWVGYKSDVLQLLKQVHIVVLPSYREGLPKSLIEAAAVGRPIITTDVPGCRECVIDGYNGYLVPARDSIQLANAIEKLVIDRDKRYEMGRNSRLLAEREFSIVNVVNRTLEIYESL